MATDGEGAGGEVSYKKGRGVGGDEGSIVAAFDGKHGWFWRNRGSAPVTVKVTATGEFGSLTREVTKPPVRFFRSAQDLVRDPIVEPYRGRFPVSDDLPVTVGGDSLRHADGGAL